MWSCNVHPLDPYVNLGVDVGVFTRFEIGIIYLQEHTSPENVNVGFQSLSCVQLFATPWTAARQASLPFTISRSLLRLMSIGSVMPSNHLILCCPHLLLPSVFLRIRVFSSEPALCIRWPKYWSFSISPSSEYSGLISFRIDWFDLLAVQGTLKQFTLGQLLGSESMDLPGS